MPESNADRAVNCCQSAEIVSLFPDLEGLELILETTVITTGFQIEEAQIHQSVGQFRRIVDPTLDVQGILIMLEAAAERADLEVEIADVVVNLSQLGLVFASFSPPQGFRVILQGV